MKRQILWALGALLLAGCSSSRFIVNVDLYREDPKFLPPMSPQEATRLLEDIEKLRAAADEKTRLRADLANTGWQIYSDTWQAVSRPAKSGTSAVDCPSLETALTNGTESPTSLDVHRCRLQNYLAASRKARGDLEPQLDAATTELQDYLVKYREEYEKAKKAFDECEQYRLSPFWSRWAVRHDVRKERRRQRQDPQAYETNSHKRDTRDPCWAPEAKGKVARLDDEWILRRLPPQLRDEDAEARKTVSNATEAYHAFSGPLEATFTIDWAGLRALLYTNLEIAMQTGDAWKVQQTHIQRIIFGLNSRIASFAEATNLIPKDRIDAAVAKDAHAPSGALLDSTLRIATELDSLRINLPDTAAARTALSDLVQGSSLVADLIDRLQDSGNPVWQILTDPANASNWQDITEKVTGRPRGIVEYRAEGNSSIVVVRHEAMRYQVHQATNNPKALVQGQLAISHAVSKAALTIAGAATGISAPTPTSDDKGNPKPPTTEERQAASKEAETFATRRANAEVEARARDVAVRNLSLQLATIAANLASAGDDKKILDEQKSQLEAVVKASRKAFAASAAED